MTQKRLLKGMIVSAALLAATLVYAAWSLAVDSFDYDPATGQVTMTLSPPEKSTLTRAAKHLKRTEGDLLKETNENWLKHVGEQMTKVREQTMRERFEKLPPDQQKIIRDVMGPIP